MFCNDGFILLSYTETLNYQHELELLCVSGTCEMIYRRFYKKKKEKDPTNTTPVSINAVLCALKNYVSYVSHVFRSE